MCDKVEIIDNQVLVISLALIHKGTIFVTQSGSSEVTLFSFTSKYYGHKLSINYEGYVESGPSPFGIAVFQGEPSEVAIKIEY